MVAFVSKRSHLIWENDPYAYIYLTSCCFFLLQERLYFSHMNFYSDDLFKVSFYKKKENFYSLVKTKLLQTHSDWFWFLDIDTNIFKTTNKRLCHSRVCAKKLPVTT